MTSLVRKNDTVWTDIAAGSIVVSNGSSWVTPVSIVVSDGVNWIDTGYLGMPNPPGTPTVSAWDYSNVTVTFTASPGSPAPTSYTIKVYNEAGALQWETGSVSAGAPYQFGVTQDTKYQIRAVAHLGSSVPEGGLLRIGIGHPEQGRMVDDWGWGALQYWQPSGLQDWTSSDGTNVASRAIDNNTGTYWRSRNRTYQGGYGYIGSPHGYWEGLHIVSLGGAQRLWCRVKCLMVDKEWIYIGAYQGGWQGSITPSSIWMYPTDNSNVWGPGDYTLLYHNYITKYDGSTSSNTSLSNVTWREFDVEGYGLQLQNISTLCLAVTELAVLSGSCYGHLAEVQIGYKDYVVVGSHYEQTVAPVPNYTW